MKLGCLGRIPTGFQTHLCCRGWSTLTCRRVQGAAAVAKCPLAVRALTSAILGSRKGLLGLATNFL